jgi:protein phosphatase
MREGRFEQLTVDHSLVEEQLKHRLITAEEAAKSRHKNVITRALGAEETIMIDADEEVLFDRDRLLLCTDGLTNMLCDEDIARIILHCEDDPQKACEKLVDAAKKRGGLDNITVILVYCKKQERQVGLLESAVLYIVSGLKKAYCGLLDKMNNCQIEKVTF